MRRTHLFLYPPEGHRSCLKKKRSKRALFAQKVAKEDIWNSTNFSNFFRNYVRKANQEIHYPKFDASFKQYSSWSQAQSQAMADGESYYPST